MMFVSRREDGKPGVAVWLEGERGGQVLVQNCDSAEEARALIAAAVEQAVADMPAEAE